MLNDTHYKKFFEELTKMASDGIIGTNRHVQKSNVQKFSSGVGKPSERSIVRKTRNTTSSNSRMVDRRILNKSKTTEIV